MCPARALTRGCVRVPGAGWQLLGFKGAIFGATHLIDEIVALPPCPGSLLLLDVSRLPRSARIDAHPSEA